MIYLLEIIATGQNSSRSNGKRLWNACLAEETLVFHPVGILKKRLFVCEDDVQIQIPGGRATAWRFASSPSALSCSAGRRQACSGITEWSTSPSSTMCYSLRILSSSQQKIGTDQCSLLANAHRGCGRSNRSTFHSARRAANMVSLHYSLESF